MSTIPTLALSLLLSAPLPVEQRDNPFWIAGVDDPRAVQRFLAALQQAVATDDARSVAIPINGPIEGEELCKAP